MSTPPSRAAALLRTLGDETRLQMLALLRQREFCVCELVDLFPISQPAVSGHLRRLKDAGLVQDDRRGMWVYYRACETIPPLAQAVLDAVALPPELQAACEAPEPGGCCEAIPVPEVLDRPAGGPRRQGARSVGQGPSTQQGSIPDTSHGRVPR